MRDKAYFWAVRANRSIAAFSTGECAITIAFVGPAVRAYDPQARGAAVLERKRSRSPAAQGVKMYSAACLDALMAIKCFEGLPKAAR
jgi:hypothetical protein